MKEVELQNRIKEIEEDLRVLNKQLEKIVLDGGDTKELHKRIDDLKGERQALIEALPAAEKKDKKAVVAVEHARQVEEAEQLLSDLGGYAAEVREHRSTLYDLARSFFASLSQALSQAADPPEALGFAPDWKLMLPAAHADQLQGKGLVTDLAEILKGSWALQPSELEGIAYRVDCAIQADREAVARFLKHALVAASMRLKKAKAPAPQRAQEQLTGIALEESEDPELAEPEAAQA